MVIVAGSSTDGASLSGDLWAAINVTSFTVYFMILKRRRNEGIDGWSFLAGVFIVGAILVTPVCLIMGDDTWEVNGRDWLLLVAMVVGPGFVGHGLISWASRHLPVTTTSLLTLGSPVVSVFGGWLMYDQHLGWVQIIGAVLVIAGLAGSVWDRRSPAQPLEPVS
jgi:drug/metabolite transporter (DMT)-like permease